MAEESRRPAKPVSEAVAEAAKAAKGLEAPGPGKRRGRPSDVFGGEIRRRDVFPLLVLHLVSREPTYGNHMIEAIEEMTQGVISVNPNTMYPLLRELEEKGFVEGAGSCRTAGPAATTRSRRRAEGVPPAAHRGRAVPRSVISSLSLIKAEVYGESGSATP